MKAMFAVPTTYGRAVYKSTSELGTILYTGQPAYYSEILLLWGVSYLTRA